MLDIHHCEHYSRHDYPARQGAIIVFHGGQLQEFNNGAHYANMMNDAVRKMDWAIFVSIGDEATEFPLHLLSHPNKKLWVQTPLPTTKADRYLIEGYPKYTKWLNCPKHLNWFFAGQITHERRLACERGILKLSPVGGKYYPTKGFGQGLPVMIYMDLMNRTRVVPCPSGPASPDTFRIWEALECGAIPLIDSRSLREETVGFWSTVLGNHPLPMIDDWEKLPEVIEPLIKDYRRISADLADWWKEYNVNFFLKWLKEDLASLGVK
jgi:hypothetical protein